REAPVRAPEDPDHALARGCLTRAIGARCARGRLTGRLEDAAARLRRQGPGTAHERRGPRAGVAQTRRRAPALRGAHRLHARGVRHRRPTRAPYGPPSWQRLASAYLRRVLEHFRYVGVLAIEFFVRPGCLIANEMAPRVHNSGHWTIEGAVTSQFENHLRAILGLPLGSTRSLGHAAMINLIGRMPPATALLARSEE